MLKILALVYWLGQVQSENFRDSLQVNIQPAPVVLPLAPPQTLPTSHAETGGQLWSRQPSPSGTTYTLTVAP